MESHPFNSPLVIFEAATVVLCFKRFMSTDPYTNTKQNLVTATVNDSGWNIETATVNDSVWNIATATVNDSVRNIETATYP